MLKPTVWRQSDWNTEETSFTASFDHICGEVHALTLVHELLTVLIAQQVFAHLCDIKWFKDFIYFLWNNLISVTTFVADLMCWLI